MHRDPRIQSTARAGAVPAVALAAALGLSCGCRPAATGFGRVTLLESRLGPSSWSVLVDDRGQGVDLRVDGSPRQAQCRRVGQGIRCWMGGLRSGFHRLAMQVGGRGTTRRSALSPAPDPSDLVIYEVVLDRFADGDPSNNIRVHKGDPEAPQGGDLAGLRARLPFVEWLGANALLVSPIWEHARTGRDPDGRPAFLARRPSGPAAALRLSHAFGAPAVLMRLLAAARKRGLRVLLDLPRPPGWSVERYFEVVRTWLARTLADGARLGPPAAGEETAWAAQARSLSEAFSPLLLLHRVPDRSSLLGQALGRLPASSRILVHPGAGQALLRTFGCGGASTAGEVPAELRGGPWVRALSEAGTLPLGARCRSAGEGSLAEERAEKRVLAALTTHLLLAEIPVIFYADGVEGSDIRAPLPALDWTEARRSGRHRLIRRLTALRRAVKALRRGSQRVRVLGDTLVVTRRQGACGALVVVHRGDAPRKLALPLGELGWPDGPVEFVERLTERGVAAPGGLLTLELEPRSVSVLVPAGQDACRG